MTLADDYAGPSYASASLALDLDCDYVVDREESGAFSITLGRVLFRGLDVTERLSPSERDEIVDQIVDQVG